MKPNRFDLTHSPVLRCHFDRSLEDSSGNGLDLVTTSGTAKYQEFEPQLFGLGPGSDVKRPQYDAALDLAGEVTVEVLGYFFGTPSAAIFASFTASGESTATNTKWQLSAESGNQLRWIHEHGSGGTDDIHLSTNAVEALPRPFIPFHAVGVRRSDGTVRLYLNGRLHGTASGVLAAPTGGTSAFLRVMFGATSFGLFGLKVIASALTDAEVASEYGRTIGVDAGGDEINVGASLWVGALTDTSATVVAKFTSPVFGIALDVGGDLTSEAYSDSDNVIRYDLTGLAPDTEYAYSLPNGQGGRFKTCPAASGEACDFTIAFSGDAETSSRAVVFDAIRRAEPLMFVHMGDLHYENNNTTNPASYHAALDNVLAQPPQARLYRDVPTAYVWDDHDSCGNNCDASFTGMATVAAVYRSRMPYYPLAHATAVYQTWDVGRVRFIMTDQRSQASADSATDNSSKTMLGATQKTWFKNLISNSAGYLIVWICPRWFGNANHADSWNNFSTERAELVDHIKANAHGRVVVLSADQHYWAIDDGSHVDHATGGGEPLRTFQCAPLDKATTSSLSGTWSHGNGNPNGVYGTMQVEDDGTDIDVTWTALNAAGTTLGSMAFTVTP